MKARESHRSTFSPQCLSYRLHCLNIFLLKSSQRWRVCPSSCAGVWATQLIPKGRRFGPFVGEKKKRSQVPSNVYMWEVGCKSEHTLLQACATILLPLQHRPAVQLRVPSERLVIGGDFLLIVLEMKETHVAVLQRGNIMFQLLTDQR